SRASAEDARGVRRNVAARADRAAAANAERAVIAKRTQARSAASKKKPVILSGAQGAQRPERSRRTSNIHGRRRCGATTRLQVLRTAFARGDQWSFAAL